MNAASLTEEAVNAEVLRIGRQGATALAGYVAISSASYSIADAFFYDSDGLYLVLSIVVWGLGYALLVLLMQGSARYEEGPRGGIGGYFGLGIVSGIAVGIGLIILIIPGLFLVVRWLSAYARYYAKGDGVTEALAWSWRETAPFQRPLAIAAIGPFVCYGAFFGIAALQEFYAADWSEAAYYVSIIALNLTISVAIAWLQLLGVAAYRIIELRSSEPVDVFE